MAGSPEKPSAEAAQQSVPKSPQNVVQSYSTPSTLQACPAQELPTASEMPSQMLLQSTMTKPIAPTAMMLNVPETSTQIAMGLPLTGPCQPAYAKMAPLTTPQSGYQSA